MRRIILAVAVCVMPAASHAQPAIRDILDEHVLPRFEALSLRTQDLAAAAAEDCRPDSEALRSAYGKAFDAWVSASHLRFGPTEMDNRAFALAFWPDTRGATPRALAGLITQADPVASSPEDYRDVSIAARGFYALEFLLYDDALRGEADAAYQCTLIETVTADIAATSASILDDWNTGYADAMLNPGPGVIYRTQEEVLQELLRALSAGLQFTSESRLGRPLGTFSRPRPASAEAYRSGRSASHVLLSLESLGDLAVHLASGDDALAERLSRQFATAKDNLIALNDPVFAGVTDPQTRFKIEITQQAVDVIRTTVTQELGPKLGVAAGFNAMDGD